MSLPQYTADLISWGAIGARTRKQVHRELARVIHASGLKMARAGIRWLSTVRGAQSAYFLSVTKQGMRHCGDFWQYQLPCDSARFFCCSNYDREIIDRTAKRCATLLSSSSDGRLQSRQ
jgi:hypothetical protein